MRIGAPLQTPPPFNIASPLFFHYTIVSVHHTHGGTAAGIGLCNNAVQHDLPPPGNSSSPCSHYSACATPHSITVRAWRALEHYIAPSLQRVTLRYPGMRQGRRYWRGGWAFLGPSLRPPYDVPAILAGIAHTQMPSTVLDDLTADWSHTTQLPIQRCCSSEYFL